MIDANSPKQLGAFKFKPFLLVCVEGAQPEQDNYLECLTQNEAEKFLLKLADLPEFSDSKLLRALERALRFEVHDSAALLFDWYKGGEPGRGESILLGMPRGRTWKHRMLNSFFRMLWSVPGINMLPVRRKVRGTLFNVLRKIPGGGTIAFYAGYPVFTLAYHAISLSADQKLQALIETLDAMDVAPGNDNLRHAVIESMSLALGRILGAEGRFADAGVYVERGLRVQPHSIHLNKVRHALSFRRRDAFVSMAASGFQSFALVCIERETAGTSKYLQCRTPGDVPAFILELTELPEYAKSKLIRALERALANEIHESAELLFSWVHENDSQTAEYISTGLPSFDCPMSFYSGYPVFTVALGGVSASPALKQQSLAGTLDAYEAARGIGEVRSSLIEAFTFALVRSLGNLGRYAEAASHVDRGLRYRPYSIYLKAARHALTLRIEGKNPPKRFDKFIGEDTGYLKQFVCPEPFKRFDIGPDGNVLVCCGHWLPTSIGNFINDPIDDVLNSEKAQHLRRSVTDGSYQYCNHLECASMIHDRLVPRTETADADIEHAIEFQDFRVKRVEQVLFALDQSCNLSCPSCRREQIMEKASDSAEKAEAVELKLLPLLPHVATLNLNSAGELFASKPSRRLLELIDDEKFPDLKLQIISNGTLFNEKEWNKFPGIHKKIQWVRISIDAARPHTFEKLRRLGIHALFLDNIRFLSQLRKEGVIPQLIFSFTYQLDNFTEMVEFVEFSREMNCDRVVFERLQNLGTFTHEEFLELAVHQQNHRLYAEFLGVLHNPIFDHADVWHDFDYAERPSVDGAVAEMLH